VCAHCGGPEGEPTNAPPPAESALGDTAPSPTGDTASTPATTGDTRGSHDTGDTSSKPHTGHTADTGEADGVLLSASGPVVCGAPESRAEQPYDLSELDALAHTGEEVLVGSGMAMFELDGPLALVVPGRSGVQLWVLGPGGWQPRPDLLPADPVVDGVGASAADYDGDGWVDLLVTTEGSNRLWRNEAGTLVDHTTEAGLSTSHHSVSASWADIDGDGDLDLAVGNYGEHQEPRSTDPSELYRNDGGWLTDVSDRLPPEVHDAWVFMTAWNDVDRDGLPELFSIHDFGATESPSRLLHNEGGLSFIVDEGAGLPSAFDGMGLGVGDLNGDGAPDLALTSLWTNGLRLSAPSLDARVGFSWGVEWAEPLGFVVGDATFSRRFGWGVDLADVDNDGDLDLPTVYGRWRRPSEAVGDPEVDALFIQGADKRFTEQGAAWGFHDGGVGRGLIAHDWTRDGFVDLAVRRIGQPTLLYASRCDERAWLQVALRDRMSANTRGIGARVELHASGTSQVRWLGAGSSSMFVSSPPEAHFGLGDADWVDTLRVTWPDGQVTVRHHLQARQRLILERTAP
jgi:enediyne biosynthesis protein E4